MAVALLISTAALAHHSFAAYDDTQIRTLQGTVATYQWTNPHVVVTMWAKLDDDSVPQEWIIVTSSPAILTRFGWQPTSLKPGERISVSCNPMRDGSPGGRLHTVTVVDTGQILRTKLSASTDSGS